MARRVRALLQRVKWASVSVGGEERSRIGKGLLIFLGVTHADTTDDGAHLAERCARQRVFEDDGGKMNLSLRDISGMALVVSQFTLYGDTKKGNRPSFTDAAGPEQAEQLYSSFVNAIKHHIGDANVRTGVFRAKMDVQLVNDGPVTLLVESKTNLSPS